MRLNKLLVFLLTLLVFSGIVMTSTIRSQRDEINKLRTRVDNLEIVINFDTKLKLEQLPETKKEFSSYRL